MTSLTKKNGLKNLKFNQIPVESPDRVLLTFTLPNGDMFIPGTLDVKLDGVSKTPILDFVENVGGTTFTFVINTNDGNRMASPPQECEDIRISYLRKPKCLT